jgi:hypothetical protein
MGLHLKGMHLIGIQFMGMHLIGVHLMSLHLISLPSHTWVSQACTLSPAPATPRTVQSRLSLDGKAPYPGA